MLGRSTLLTPAEARQLRHLGREVVDEHRERQRQHQEVDPLAARGDEAERQPDEHGDDDCADDRRPRRPGRGVAAVGGHEVRVRQAGGPVDRHLAERDHPAVGGQEDQAGRGEAQPQRLREDLRDPEVRDEQREDREHGHHAGKTQPAGPAEGGMVGGLGLGLDRRGVRRKAHAGLPNRPSGRTASTTTRSANVSRIE